MSVRVDPAAQRQHDPDRLAVVSHDAKLTYRAWAPPGWRAPTLDVERVIWHRRLLDPAGATIVAVEAASVVGTVHFTDARTRQGSGKPIRSKAHVSGMFVAPHRWGEGIGGRLHDAALGAMRDRGYREAELFTAEANGRSRSFYEARGWRLTGTGAERTHDGLVVVFYERTDAVRRD